MKITSAASFLHCQALMPFPWALFGKHISIITKIEVGVVKKFGVGIWVGIGVGIGNDRDAWGGRDSILKLMTTPRSRRGERAIARAIIITITSTTVIIAVGVVAVSERGGRRGTAGAGTPHTRLAVEVSLCVSVCVCVVCI